MSKQLEVIEINPKITAQASVIWLHGLGADGSDFTSIVPELSVAQKKGVRFIFPHAPLRPVTINAGMTMRAWFDLYGLNANSPQDESGLRQGQQGIDGLIAKEINRNIPSHKIVLAGFSQGGALALFCGLRYPLKLAGILGLSSFLPLADKLTAEINSMNTNTPIMLAHGYFDQVVSSTFGEMTKTHLEKIGYSVEWHTYPMGHSVCPAEIQDIDRWLDKVI